MKDWVINEPYLRSYQCYCTHCGKHFLSRSKPKVVIKRSYSTNKTYQQVCVQCQKRFFK
jgi:hypothetical protein